MIPQDHQFCFRLGCANRSNGTTLVLPYRFADSYGEQAQAVLTLPFCGIECLFSFVKTKTLVGIIEKILSTHWRERRKEGSQSDAAPIIQLAETIGDPVITEFIIPTSWQVGKSHAIVRLPFGSPEAAASFWVQCERSYHLMLLYLFEHELKDQEDRPIPATINFVVPVRGTGKAVIALSFDSLGDAHELWENHDKDFAKALLARLRLGQ